MTHNAVETFGEFLADHRHYGRCGRPCSPELDLGSGEPPPLPPPGKVPERHPSNPLVAAARRPNQPVGHRSDLPPPQHRHPTPILVVVTISGQRDLPLGRTGQGGEDFVLASILLPIGLCALAAQLALAEEELFRHGSEEHGAAQIARACLLFGLMHQAVG